MGYRISAFSINDLVMLLKGAAVTIEISAIAIIIGLMLGVVVGILRTSKIKVINSIARIYVEVFRGTPVLMQVFLFYYGLRLFHFEFPALFSASLAFIFNLGATAGETLKGCIEGVPKSQWEASSTLGFTYFKQLQYIIFPQVIRTAVPPVMGLIVGLIKDTSLASIVGFMELTRAASGVMSKTMNPNLTFAIVAAIYFIICFPLTFYSRKLELKFKN